MTRGQVDTPESLCSGATRRASLRDPSAVNSTAPRHSTRSGRPLFHVNQDVRVRHHRLTNDGVSSAHLHCFPGARTRHTAGRCRNGRFHRHGGLVCGTATCALRSHPLSAGHFRVADKATDIDATSSSGALHPVVHSGWTPVDSRTAGVPSTASPLAERRRAWPASTKCAHEPRKLPPIDITSRALMDSGTRPR